MLIDISELLDDPLFVEPIEVGISTRGFDAFGDPTETVVWQTIEANVQTVGDDALQRLEPAERYKPTRQFFTNRIEVRVGDYFKEYGKTYRCITDQDFKKYGYSDSIGMLYNGVEDKNEGGFEPPFGKYFGFADDEFSRNYGFNVGEFTDK